MIDSPTSKTVARWTWTRVELEDLRHLGYISRHKTGEFVNFADYDSREGELVAEIERLVRERDAWEHSAAEFLSGMEYYRRLVDEIGKLLGDAAYIADDGNRSEDVLRAKVPELVKARLAVEREMTPSAWLVKLDDGWRYLGSTKEDAERTQREKGGVIVPLYESLRDETSPALTEVSEEPGQP